VREIAAEYMRDVDLVIVEGFKNEPVPKIEVMRALEKRPVTLARVEQAVDDIESGLRARGQPEVTSKEVGRLATEALRDMDQLAYIRFASVYHSYEDISTLKREVDRLMKQRTPAEKG